MSVGADKAVDGASGKGKGVEDGLGFVKVIDFGTELGDLAGEDAHDADLIFKRANGGFFESVELGLGETTGVEPWVRALLLPG